ncbi:3-hydroxyisobutyryl-CoA hydrolase 1 [Cryptomeria japonica]|uniref:3-hydroxyisobutyryl-CoA hydrolase 1 n=1 Tax=Cryptomeria japonica TaxID=3369 RepID=UPI0027D9FAD6|nr:3-hydroxyisobutyryl-CoA hydrolase 1 [Cryptomeria japonica]
MTSTAEDNQILTDEKFYSRTIILNRPRQLNALSNFMNCRLKELFLKWENDNNVNVLIIKGIGRAFCSGGDVANVCLAGNSGDYSHGTQYFWNEYIMNYILATCRKPQVALLNGIVMGGGSGISIHGKFRVATEKTLYAMPETGLGLHPDVGASYFLSRLPGFLGEYVGLTGVRLDGAELVTCGLATHFVHSTRLQLLEETLAKVEKADPNLVSSVIDGFSDKICVKDGSAFQRLDIIDKCFAKETVEDILSTLELESKYVADKWLKMSIQSIKKASPVSLKITLRSVREGRKQHLHECLIREYRLSCHCLLREISNDFYEGCRAILVDKDRNPKWNPDKLEHVTQDMIDHYFSPVEGFEDLRLPIDQRASSTNYIPSKL